MRDLLQDIRYAARSFRNAPAFTAVVVFILAVGIGINTTIFTAVNAVLVRPLPYGNAARLVDIGTDWENNEPRQVMSYDDFQDVRKLEVFEDVVAWQSQSINLADGAEEPERIEGATISARLFPALGVAPQLGRTFTAEEEQRGGPNAVILSDVLWRRRFHGDRAVIGRAVTINGEPHVIVGVMPPRFAFPEGQQAWTPLKPLGYFGRGSHHLNVAGLLRAGVNAEQAQHQLTNLFATLEREYPESNTNKSASLAPLHSDARADIGTSLYAMMGAVAFVLLIACANVANLLLVRGAARQREIAVRTALGAGQWRLVRQLLTESVLLAVAGAALGTVLAVWGVSLIDSVIPPDRPWYVVLTFDWRVAAFTALVAVAAGLLFGLAPALQVAGRDLTESLKDGGQGAGSSGRRQRLRSTLVVAEIALSVVLVAGAALMLRSFAALRQADTGIDRRNLLTARVFMAGPQYEDEGRRAAFVEAVRQRLMGAPGVAAAGSVVNLPLAGSMSISAVEIEGRPAELGQEHSMEMRGGSGDFLQAMGVTLLRGRPISPDEVADTSRHVIIINETAARTLFEGADPIGKRIKFARDTSTLAWEVIGIARDVRASEVDREPISQGWLPYHDWASRSVAIVVRTTSEPRTLVPAVRAAIGAVDGSLPVFDVFTMDYVVEQSFWERRLFGQLFGTFGVIALLLAAVGLYSVIAWSVAQRTREIGVRMALGAQLGDVTKMVVGGGMKLTFIGIGLGALLSLLVTGALRTLLYGVQPRDPAVLAGTALLLGIVALVATFIPARRAARVDPMVALRNE